MTIIKHRDICGLVGALCGACIVTLVALGFGAAPARAQGSPPLPPQVTFIGNGEYTGTLQIQGLTLPITGTLIYSSHGSTENLKISVETQGQITSNTWLTDVIPTVIDEWETVSTFPGTCRKEVLSGASYPQCNTWHLTPRGLYSLECTVTAQGTKATLNFLAQVNLHNNMLEQLTEKATITGENDNSQGNESDMTNSLTITMTSQSNSPPPDSEFTLPSICNAPTGNNQSQNDNSQGNENELGCTGTIPNICF